MSVVLSVYERVCFGNGVRSVEADKVLGFRNMCRFVSASFGLLYVGMCVGVCCEECEI